LPLDVSRNFGDRAFDMEGVADEGRSFDVKRRVQEGPAPCPAASKQQPFGTRIDQPAGTTLPLIAIVFPLLGVGEQFLRQPRIG